MKGSQIAPIYLLHHGLGGRLPSWAGHGVQCEWCDATGDAM